MNVLFMGLISIGSFYFYMTECMECADVQAEVDSLTFINEEQSPFFVLKQTLNEVSVEDHTALSLAIECGDFADIRDICRIYIEDKNLPPDVLLKRIEPLAQYTQITGNDDNAVRIAYAVGIDRIRNYFDGNLKSSEGKKIASKMFDCIFAGRDSLEADGASNEDERIKKGIKHAYRNAFNRYSKMQILVKILLEAGGHPSSMFLKKIIANSDLGTMKIIADYVAGISEFNYEYDGDMIHYALEKIKPCVTGLNIIKYLLDMDPYLATSPNNSKDRPLHVLAKKRAGTKEEAGFCSLVAVELLNRNAYVDIPNGQQETPLFLACLSGHMGLVELLLSKGASPAKIINNKGESVFLAVITHPTSARRIIGLMSKYANPAEFVFANDNSSNNAWHRIASRENNEQTPKIRRLLVECQDLFRHSGIPAKNNDGNTPLHIAAMTDNLLVFKYIFEQVCNNDLSALLARNNLGDTIFHTACRHDSSQIVQRITDLCQEGLMCCGISLSFFTWYMGEGKKFYFLNINEAGETAVKLAGENVKKVLRQENVRKVFGELI